MDRKMSFGPLAALVLMSAVLAGVIFWFMTPKKEPLPRLFPMPSFQLTNEQGRAFGASNVSGKVVVANFVFTRCPTVCPTLTAKMAQIQSRIPSEKRVHFLSFSVDPKHDTPEILAAYGKEFGQDPTRWNFLTGDVGDITKAVETGFKIGIQGADDPDATPFDIVHGEHFVLVDGEGTIRGYYPNEEASLDALIADVSRLLEEMGS